MADNFTANPGTGGDIFAADDVAGVKVPYSKMDIGADGVSSPVNAANPMPVGLTDGTNPVVIKPLSTAPANADNALMTQAIIHGRTTAGGGAFVDVKVNPSGALAADISDSTNVGVTGPLTDAQLRASAVPISSQASYAEDTPHSSGAIGNLMLAIRADSDSPTAGDGDYTVLKLDEAGRLKVASTPASYADTTGNITANAQTVFANVDRASNVTISMAAISLVGHNATFEYSNNSTNGTNGNWYGVQVARSNGNTADTTTGVLAATPVYGWEVSVNAYKWIRVRATAHTSGTAAYIIKQGTYATEPVPIIQVTGTQPVSFTQPALVASTARVGFTAGAGIWYDDSAVLLAALATFTGTSRDATVTATATAMANAATYNKEVRVSAETDQTGTLWVEFSRNNTDWRRCKSSPTAAITGGGQFAEIVFRPSWRYWRAGFTNGAVLQTRFTLNSMMIAA